MVIRKEKDIADPRPAQALWRLKRGEEKGESRGIVTLVSQPSAFDVLNRKQQEAAQFGSGPLLIIAGAGTGKTNTLAHRVAHLVLSGAKPERILLLTFTRRAALEMTRRTQRIVGSAFQVPVPGSPVSRSESGTGTGTVGTTREVRLPWSGTFHSIANRLIRRHAAAVGLDTELQRARPGRCRRLDRRPAP